MAPATKTQVIRYFLRCLVFIVAVILDIEQQVIVANPASEIHIVGRHSVRTHAAGPGKQMLLLVTTSIFRRPKARSDLPSQRTVRSLQKHRRAVSTDDLTCGDCADIESNMFAYCATSEHEQLAPGSRYFDARHLEI